MSGEASAMVKASSERALRAARGLTWTQMHFLQSVLGSPQEILVKELTWI